MNKSKHFPGPKILTPCPKHKTLPDTTVCGTCLGELGEFNRIAQEMMQRAPIVMGELHQEGMRYFDALSEIANPNTACQCPSGGKDGMTAHSPNCGVGMAQKALEGYQSRILHRPATAHLMETKQQLVDISGKPVEKGN